MKRVFTAVLFIVLTTTLSTLLLAKGDTVKITIENIWSGLIIDSASRIDEAPVGLPQYKVSFYEGCDPKELRACHNHFAPTMLGACCGHRSF